MNCINVDCTITAYGNGFAFDSYIIGGIVGKVNDEVEITNCANFADVSADVPVTIMAGGIVGAGGKVQISQCFNMGTIKAGLNDTDINKLCTPNLAYAGGIAGNINTTIENCFNRGSIFSNAIEQEETVTTYTDKYQEVVNGSSNSELYSAKLDGITSSTPLGGGDHYRRGIIIEKNEIENFRSDGTPVNTVDPVNVLTRTYNAAYAGGIAGYSIEMPECCYNTGTVSGGKSYYNLYFTYYFATVSNAYGGDNPVRNAWLNDPSTFEAMRVILADVPDRFYYSPITGNMDLINSSSFIESNCYYLDSLKSDCYSNSEIGYRNYSASRTKITSGSSSYWAYADINGRTPIPSFSNYYESEGYKLSELTNEVNIEVRGFTSYMKTSIQYTDDSLLCVYINGNDSGYGKHRMLSVSIPGYNAEKNYLNSTDIAKSESDLKNFNGISLSKDYWATNSLINNGYPYLKSFYWKDTAEPF